jgi:hypothetical protein
MLSVQIAENDYTGMENAHTENANAFATSPPLPSLAEFAASYPRDPSKCIQTLW